MSALGLSLLTKLGLRPDQVESLKKMKPKTEAVYVRDQTGLGYTHQAPDFMQASENAFAKLQAAAKMVRSEDEDDGKMDVKPLQHKVFIPTRLRKRTVGSLSQEDLACILATDKPAALPVEAVVETAAAAEEEAGEQPRRRRRRRHHPRTEEAPAEQQCE